MESTTRDSSSTSGSTSLEEARNLLSSLTQTSVHEESERQTCGAAAEWRWKWCLKLAKDLHSSIVAGLGPLPGSPDWIVVKSVFELVVRWGIYPDLSAGVGIPLQKRFKRTAATAVAAAVSTHAVQEPVDHPPIEDDHNNACSLFEAAEFLSSVLLSDQSSAARSLLLGSHVVDLFAAYLQLAYSSLPTIYSHEQIHEQNRVAVQRLDEIANSLPVDHVVEALLTLLHQSNPAPPAWMSLEAGKLMSKSVMREGGVAAVLERLVGGADARGNIKTYLKVATHLARSPKYIASSDDYYKKICPQLLPLFLLHMHQARFIEGESAFITHTNMQHTAVMIACVIAKNARELLEKYLLMPSLYPLLCLMKLQNQGDELLSHVTENQLVVSFLQMQVLLTAGHAGADYIKQYIIQQTLPCAPVILGLHYLLNVSSLLNLVIMEEKTQRPDSEATTPVNEALGSRSQVNEQLKFKERDQKGVCNYGKSLTSFKDGFVPEEESTYECFKAAVAEVASAHVAQPAEQSLSMVLAFEEKRYFHTIRWPSVEGRIADALTRGKGQPYKVPMFLSKMILETENWELASSFMSKLMLKMAQQQEDYQRGLEDSIFKSKKAEEMLAVTHYLEMVLDEIGARAVEKDIAAAILFVRDLVYNPNISRDEDFIDIVLQSIQRLAYNIRERSQTIENELGPKFRVVNKQELLSSLLFIVERVLFSSGHSDNIRLKETSLRSLLLQYLKDM